MYRLEVCDYPAIGSLLQTMRHCVPAWAVYRGTNPGRIYVDDKSQPTAAIIWTKWGYYYLLGDRLSKAVVRSVAGLVADELAPLSASQGETGPILYPSSADWEDEIAVILRKWDYVRAFRRVFAFDDADFSDGGSGLDRRHERLSLRQIDADLIEKLGDDMRREILGSWDSVERFLEHGFGFCVLDDQNSLLSCCLSVACDGERAEMSIFTREDHRRRGLATAVGQAFIRRCRSLGLTPSYECFWSNAASSALARRLSFQDVGDVPVYQWRIVDK